MPRRCLSLVVLVAVLVAFWPGVAEAQYFRFGKNKVQYENLDWQYLQSTHFDVFYYEPGGHALADFTARAAEDAYAQISDLFGYRIADRISLLVYQSHNDFVVTNAVDLPTYSEGIGGVTELFKNRVAIPFTGDYRDFRRVIHHELVHAVINDMFYGGSIQVDHPERHPAPDPAVVQRGAGRVFGAGLGHELGHVRPRRRGERLPRAD